MILTLRYTPKIRLDVVTIQIYKRIIAGYKFSYSFVIASFRLRQKFCSVLLRFGKFRNISIRSRYRNQLSSPLLTPQNFIRTRDYFVNNNSRTLCMLLSWIVAVNNKNRFCTVLLAKSSQVFQLFLLSSCVLKKVLRCKKMITKCQVQTSKRLDGTKLVFVAIGNLT